MDKSPWSRAKINGWEGEGDWKWRLTLRRKSWRSPRGHYLPHSLADQCRDKPKNRHFKTKLNQTSFPSKFCLVTLLPVPSLSTRLSEDNNRWQCKTKTLSGSQLRVRIHGSVTKNPFFRLQAGSPVQPHHLLPLFHLEDWMEKPLYEPDRIKVQFSMTSTSSYWKDLSILGKKASVISGGSGSCKLHPCTAQFTWRFFSIPCYWRDSCCNK